MTLYERIESLRKSKKISQGNLEKELGFSNGSISKWKNSTPTPEIMRAIGIPDQYILQRGGWSSDSVMKTVYRNTIDLETVRQNKKINDHFKRLSV